MFSDVLRFAVADKDRVNVVILLEAELIVIISSASEDLHIYIDSVVKDEGHDNLFKVKMENRLC